MRAVLRVVSAAAASVLLVVSVITLVEVTLAALDRPPWLVDHTQVREDLARRSWDDPVLYVVWSLLIGLGLGLLALALSRGRPLTVALSSGTAGASVSVQRRSLERYLAGVAEGQPGVQGASARVRGGRLRVRADTTRAAPDNVRERVQAALAERIAALGPEPELTSTVTTHPRED